MKNKRFWLLSACFTILNTLLANAVIFDESRSSGRYFGGYGFGVSLRDFYDAYYGFVDFFLFLLIFGGLIKTVFKGEEKHNNALAIGLATALSLGLTLYLDNEGIRLFDLGPWIAGLAIILIIALVWNFLYKKLGHGRWVVASLITLALVLLGALITTAIRGEGSGSFVSWSIGGGISFGALLWFLLALFLIIIGVKHLAKKHGFGPDFGRPWGGRRHRHPETRTEAGDESDDSMPPLGIVDDPATATDSLVKEKYRMLRDCVSRHAAKIEFLDRFFHKTRDPEEITRFLKLYLSERKIKFAKGVKMRFKDFSAYLATEVFPDFDDALTPDYPPGVLALLSVETRKLLTELRNKFRDATNIYTATPEIQPKNLGMRGDLAQWNAFAQINSDNPAERDAAINYFSDKILTPMDAIFELLKQITFKLQSELVSN